MRTSLARRGVLAATVAVVTAALLPGVASAVPSPTSTPVVVVSGLNNPRQLSLVDGVELFIAEAGRGGPTEVPGGGPEGPLSVGTTGSVSVVLLPQLAHKQKPWRVLTGLLSAAAPDGSGATGSDSVSARGLFGPVYVAETFIPPGVLPPALEKAQNGKLLRARPFGPASPVADISAYEATNDPDGKGVDSNPYSVLALRDGQLVADAAGNDVLRVDARGRISVFHVFANVTTGPCAAQFDPTPQFPGCNFVPTSLATDRSGNVYVGSLSSLVPGQAQVVKLDPTGRRVLKVWGGFTAVNGLTVDRQGAVYVSQLFGAQAHPAGPGSAGVLTKVSPDGTRTDVDVPFPAGVAVDPLGNVFVSAFSIAPDTGLGGPGTSGQVWRLRF